jgi:diguanylate cyclase (GGDEF)-like protein
MVWMGDRWRLPGNDMSTIRARLALVMLLALLPALAVMLQAAGQNRREHLAAGGARLLQAARLIAEEHEQLVEGARQLLLALRTAPALEGDDPTACRDHLAEVLADALGRYADLLLFGHDGRPLCDALGTADTLGVADQPYFREALAGGLAVGPHMATRDATGRPVLPIALLLPAAADRPARVLAAHIGLDWLDRYDERLELPAGAVLEVADAAGSLLASSAAGSAPGRIVPWTAGYAGPRVLLTEGRLVGLAPAAGGDLLVAVSVPEAEVTAAADLLLRLELAGVGLALLLGFALAGAFGELAVARRLRALTAFAARLRDGDLAARLPWHPGSDELGELARVLGHMACRLERRVGALAASEAEHRHRARHDELTGLPNRRGLADRLGAELAAAQRHRGALALLLLDLDRFKGVNDTLGHAAGDALLAAAAGRMRATLREEDLVARLGGDEFAVLLAGPGDGFAPEQTARRLMEVLARPFRLAAGHEVRTGASVGVALFPVDGRTADELLAAADRGLYAAKRAGRGTWRAASRSVTGPFEFPREMP